MPKPRLNLALSHYDRHIPFFDGSVQLEDFDLDVREVGQSVVLKHGDNRHGRMLQKGEFDACEVSLSSYLMAKSRGWPFTAVPVFPRRLFSLSMIWVNAEAGIQSPKDLVGRKVGLTTFQTTLSVLTKGDLQTEYDVPWRNIHWFTRRKETVEFRPEEGVKIDLLPEGKKIGSLLLQGEIDALVMPHPWPNGFKKNRSNLERFIGYSLDQGLLKRELSPEELFVEKTLDTYYSFVGKTTCQTKNGQTSDC